MGLKTALAAEKSRSRSSSARVTVIPKRGAASRLGEVQFPFCRACAILKSSCAFVRHRALARVFGAKMRVGPRIVRGVVRAAGRMEKLLPLLFPQIQAEKARRCFWHGKIHPPKPDRLADRRGSTCAREVGLREETGISTCCGSSLYRQDCSIF